MITAVVVALRTCTSGHRSCGQCFFISVLDVDCVVCSETQILVMKNMRTKEYGGTFFTH